MIRKKLQGNLNSGGPRDEPLENDDRYYYAVSLEKSCPFQIMEIIATSNKFP